jgi:transketolase
MDAAFKYSIPGKRDKQRIYGLHLVCKERNCEGREERLRLRTDAPAGNYIHYGVREFAMTAITNGIALHGGFIPYGGTFLVFSDYACNAVRMALPIKPSNRPRACA